MELGRNENYISTISTKFCLYMLFAWCFASTSCTMHRYFLNLGNIKSFSDIEISAYLHFLHCQDCVRIWDELTCLWGRLCMVTLYYRMTFKPHADKVQTLNAQTPELAISFFKYGGWTWYGFIWTKVRLRLSTSLKMFKQE